MRYRTNAAGKKRVTTIAGDGIGPEVVAATRTIIDATGARIAWEECEAGAEVFKRGLASGVPPETIASIRDTRVALKGPLETPIGFGEKSRATSSPATSRTNAWRWWATTTSQKCSRLACQ